MSETLALDVVFLDIGNTLGKLNDAGHFVAFPSSGTFLDGLRRIGLRVGVITNLSPMTDDDGWDLLVDGGLAPHVERALFVSDVTAGVAKPDPAIFRFAAARAGVKPERALFVGENLLELAGAAAAGMRTLWRPTAPGNELPG